MSFSTFIDRIASPALRHVAMCWRAACRDRAMPGRRDVEVTFLPMPAPHVWSCAYDRESALFFDFRSLGAPLKNGDHVDALVDRHRRVVEGPALMHGHGCVFRHLGSIGIGERIALPLAEDGVRPDGIFGAIIYGRIFAVASIRAQTNPFENLRCTFDDLDPPGSAVNWPSPASAEGSAA